MKVYFALLFRVKIANTDSIVIVTIEFCLEYGSRVSN